MKRTPRWRVGRRRNIAPEHDTASPRCRFRRGHGREQGPGVRVKRFRKQFPRRCEFHQFAQIHDGNPVADVLHHGQVVGNQEVGQPKIILEINHQVEHLRLDGDVEGRYRFVCDNEIRLQGQGPGNAETLALATGELVGEFRHVFRAQSDPLHEFRGLPALLRTAGNAVVLKGLADYRVCGHAGVERQIRVLEHELELTAQRAQFTGAKA